MKNFIVFLLGLLLLASCQPIETQTIVLRSEGEVVVEPDIAKFDINLTCVDKNIEKMQADLVAKSNALNEQLKSLGVDEKEIRTTDISISESYEWKNGTRVFQGYSGSVDCRVTLHDISKLGKIYTALLTNKNIQLNWLQYTHSQIDSLQNAAYLNALDNADVLAEQLMTKLGASQKAIVQVSNVKIESSAGRNSPRLLATKEIAFEEEASDATVAVNSNQIIVSAVLFVEYCVK